MADYIVINGIRIDKDHENFVSETFGRLTAIGPKFQLPIGGKQRGCQVCQCTCGDTSVYITNALTGQRIKQCKRCAIKQARESHKIHGETNKTKEFTAWWNMKRRCHDPKATGYADWGGRGIRVCDRWQEPNGQGYLNFLEDMGRCPPECNSIERKEVNGNYYADNCKWATVHEQARNKRNTVHITAFGKTQCLADWAVEYGLSRNTLKGRLERGWLVEDALTTPKGQPRPKRLDTFPKDANSDHCI